MHGTSEVENIKVEKSETLEQIEKEEVKFDMTEWICCIKLKTHPPGMICRGWEEILFSFKLLVLLGTRGLETIAYRWKAKRVQLLV